VTGWIETRANELLKSGAEAVSRVTFAAARRAATTHAHDYVLNYVRDLGTILDMDVIRGSNIRNGCRPSGGSRRGTTGRASRSSTVSTSRW